MDLIESLQNIGLNEKQSRIYLALLQMEKATAYSLAKKSGLKKSTSYSILEQLMTKGFVRMVPRSKKQLYKAVPFDKCVKIAEEKIKISKKMLPEFEAIKKGGKEKVSVAYFEGINGIKQMYEKMIKEMRGKEILGFTGSEKNAPKELQEYWQILHQKRLKHKVRGRGIAVLDPSTRDWKKKAKKFLLSLKFISPKEYKSDISIEIYRDKVQIISFRYLQGILIKNKDVAKAMKDIFKMVWQK